MFKVTEGDRPQSTEGRKIVVGEALSVQKKKYRDLEERLRTVINESSYYVIGYLTLIKQH